MKQLASLNLAFCCFCLASYSVLGQDDHIFFADDALNGVDEQSRRAVFNCTFESGVCDLDLILPNADAMSETDLRWFRRQAVILPNGTVLHDHTTGKTDGTLLFASGGAPGSVTMVKTSPNGAPLNCTAALCCFNAYALMNQSPEDPPGSLAFFIVQNSFGSDPIRTILANMSFTSFGNYWTNIQRTFHADSHPFRIVIEGRNGGGGVGFYLAVDDISVTPGLCDSDKEIFGDYPGLCGAPPAVVGGEALIEYGHSLGAGSQVPYTCSFGYDLIGPTSVTCLLDGQWTTPPICSPYRTTYSIIGSNSKSEHSQHESLVFAEERSVGVANSASKLVSDCVWGTYLPGDLSAITPSISETKMLLFTANPLKCSGKLLRWVFLTAPGIEAHTPLYLSVWRPVHDGATNKYSLVGLNQFTTESSQRLIQFVVGGDQRFEVQVGDVVGIIHKETTTASAVHMYDQSSLPSGRHASDLFSTVVVNMNLEDISDGNVNNAGSLAGMTISIDPSVTRQLLPLLQVYVGGSDCDEKIWDEVSFTGINTVIADATTEDTCWDFCRKKPSCYAVSFDSARKDCRVFSYISTEVHFTSNTKSMVKLCHADCDMKLLSDGDDFDIAFEGTPLELGPYLQTAADCELACRYSPACMSFSYSNPFRAGTCTLFSNSTGLRRDTNMRSFRKWGCEDVHLIDKCEKCVASFQCKGENQCLPFGDSGETRCIPPGFTGTCESVLSSLGSVLCPSPPQILRGHIVNYDQYGSAPTTYACDPGFEMIGSATVPCLSGIWKAPLPLCRASCPNLPLVENGRVEVLPSSGNAKEAIVSCNDGFRIVGMPIISCMSASNWSPVPSCNADCGIPPGVGNAGWTVTQGTQSLPIAVRYDCNAGFVLNGANTLRCSNGVWGPQAPTCQLSTPVINCPAPPTLANGAIADSGKFDDNSASKFATYRCLPGYELMGQATSLCRTGTWEKLPICAALCGPIPTVSNAETKILTSKNGQPVTVQFECINGWRLEGDPIVSCISSLWSRPPNCINSVTKPEYCGQPPGVVYGSWRAILQLGDNPLSVEYWCQDGYYLVGPVRLTCIRTTSGASWQPAVVPLCQPSHETPKQQKPATPVPSKVNMPPIAKNQKMPPLPPARSQGPPQGQPQMPYQGQPQMPYQGHPQMPYQGQPQMPYQGLPQGPLPGLPQGPPVMNQGWKMQSYNFQGMSQGVPPMGPFTVGGAMPAVPPMGDIRGFPVDTSLPVLSASGIPDSDAALPRPVAIAAAIPGVPGPDAIAAIIPGTNAISSGIPNAHAMSAIVPNPGGIASNIPNASALGAAVPGTNAFASVVPNANSLGSMVPNTNTIPNANTIGSYIPGTNAIAWGIPNANQIGAGIPNASVIGSGIPGPNAISSGIPSASAIESVVPGTNAISSGIPGPRNIASAVPVIKPAIPGPGDINRVIPTASDIGNNVPHAGYVEGPPGVQGFINQVVSSSMNAAGGAGLPLSVGTVNSLSGDGIQLPMSRPGSRIAQGDLLPGQSLPYVHGDAAAVAASPLIGQSYSRYSPQNYPQASYGSPGLGYGQSQWQLTGAEAAALVSATVPTFTSSSCSMIPVVANARYHILAGDKMSEVVRIRYVCYNGFEPTGPAEIECRGEGVWTPPPPLCRPEVGRFRHCGSPPSVLNSVIYPLPEIPGEPRIIQYECNQGYRLVGNHTLYCVDGNWRSASVDAQPPICIPLEKTTTTTSTPGVAFPRMNFFPTVDQGFTTVRPRGLQRRIVAHGVGGDLKRKQCPTPPSIQGAHVWLLSGSIENPVEIEYHCQRKGYFIKVDSRLRCINGAWRKVVASSSKPRCVPDRHAEDAIATQQFNDAVAGDDAMTNDPPAEQGVNEDENYADCGPEPLVVHAVSERLSPNSLRYDCQESLSLVGNPVVDCNSDGLWSEPPYCIFIPSSPQSSTTESSSSSTTSTTTTYSTTTSTTPTPSSSINVDEEEGIDEDELDDGSVCTYSRPPVVRNAVHQIIKGTRRNPQAIRFHCLAGYEPIGAIVVRCYRGAWGPPPRCIKSSEGEKGGPTIPPQFFGEEYNPARSFPRPSGGSRLSRAQNHRKSAPPPPPPPPVPIITTTTQPPSTQPQEAYCWKMPHFLNGYFLAVPSPLHNGAVKSIRFVCKPGYLLFGPSMADCLPGEEWSVVPRCEPIPKAVTKSCKPVPVVDGAKYAVLSGSQANPTRVRYICNANRRMYAQGGTAGVMTCDNSTGTWNPEPPRCEVVEEASTSMPVVITSTQPPVTTTTTPRTTTKPTTTLPPCPLLPTFEGGAYHYINSGPAASAVLVCSEGFVMPKGQIPIVRCSVGRWQPDPLPTCHRQGCSTPVPNVEHAIRAAIDNAAGRGFSFQCLPGFEMLGEPSVFCNNGAWGAVPRCRQLPPLEKVTVQAPRAPSQPLSCRPLPPFPNGFFEMVSGSAGQLAARFQCLPGYALSGRTLVPCGPDGQWPELPTCQAVHPVCARGPPTVKNARRFTIPLFDGGVSPNQSTTFLVADESGHLVSSISMARYRFECLPGFQLVGNPFIDCSPQGIWTQPPVCQVDKSLVLSALLHGGYIGTNCASPPPMIRNGRYRLLRHHPSSLLFYYCKPHFDLLGPPIVFCDKKTAQWTMGPVCIRKKPEIAVACGSPPSILNAIIRDPIVPASSLASSLASEYHLGGNDASSNVVFLAEEGAEQKFPLMTKIPIECIPGFQLVGEPVIQCLPGGMWSRSPKCIGCGSPPFVANAFSEPLVGRGHSVRYRCQTGHTLEGESIVTCQQGFWSEPPKCRSNAPVQCGAPPVVANSQIVDNSYGKSHDGPFGDGHWVRYACIPGFQLVGSGPNSMERAVEVMAHGRVTCSGSQWSAPPSCEHEQPIAETGCYAGSASSISASGPIAEPINTEMAICPSYYFTCAGYINHWEIGAMPTATGSTVAYVSVWRRSEVSGAFRLVGANKVQPRPGIHMYEVQPSEQIRVEVGDFIGIYYADSSMTGVVPYRLDPTGTSECLTAPLTSSRIMAEIGRRGFVFVGSPISPRQYIIRALIDNALPLCPELVPVDPSASGLVVSGFGLASGSKRLVECKPGYRLEGPSVVTCDNGFWKPAVPACFPLANVDDAEEVVETADKVTKPSKRPKKKPMNKARNKFSKFSKTAEGDADEEAATTATLNDCGSPPKIVHGYAVRRSFDAAEYECEPGYLLVGHRQVTCSFDEEAEDDEEPQWPTEKLPRCADVRSVLTSSDGEKADGEEGKNECTAVPPTALPHSDPLVVQAARSTEAVLCPQLVVSCTGIVDKWIFLSDRDDNASVILSVWRQLDEGRFVVVGANKLRVAHKGRIVKGVSPDEQFKAMRGDFIGVYYEDEAPGPVVSLIAPLGLKFTDERAAERSSNEADSRFQCFTYQKSDNDIRQAMRNPGWLNVPRRASARRAAPPAVGLILKGPLTCEPPSPLIHGRVHAVGGGEASKGSAIEKEEAAIGQRVAYTCDQGYRFNTSGSEQAPPASVVITCMESGRWKPEPPAKCIRNCPPPAVIDHSDAEFSYSANAGPQIGDTIRYSCYDGFINIGPPALMCQQNYTWSRPAPHCVRSCGEPPRVSHASIDVVNGHGREQNSTTIAIAGDSFTYSCHNGFLMVGRNVITCTDSGTWHPAVMPRCVVACEPLPIIENARLLTPSPELSLDSALAMETPVFTAGDRVMVQCEHGFISTAVSDHSAIMCGEDGRWMKPLPRCLITCGSFPTIENGRLQLTAEPSVLADPLMALAGQTAVIECAPGYMPLDGHDTIRCQEDGSFTRLPVCINKPVSCRVDTIPYVTNSILLSDTDNGTHVGAHRHVSCLPGYLLQGDSAIVCLPNGEWSAPPSCELVDCGDPPSVLTAVANRLVLNNHNGTNVPQVAYQFSCQYGYELVGQAKVTCQARDQSWTDLPRCIDVGNPLCRVGSAVPIELHSPIPLPMIGEPVLADMMHGEVADLSLCPAMRAVCTGEADRWIFLSQRDDGSVVIFGVWRPLSEDRFQLVGSTRWAASAVGRQVITLDESTAIRVQIGDIIGVHYEQELEVPVVPSVSETDHHKLRNSPYPSCYRLPLNDADISMAMSGVSYVALSSAVSDPDKHLSAWNRPAVQLLVRPARGCTAPADVTHGQHNFDSTMNDLDTGIGRSPLHAPPGHVVTFSCDSGYQLAGTAQISCQPDGSWAPSAPLCVPETPNCRVGHDWALQPLPESVPLPGRWMNMYPSMRFGCSAEIVEWRVYSIATTPTQVFLDVWRKVNGDWFELVGSNNFTLSAPGLVSLRVPTTSRIMVDHDCFIGLHYAEIEEQGSERGSSTGAIAHWTAQAIEAANQTVAAIELHDFMSRRMAERDLRSEIVGYHYVSMQHSQRQQTARTPAIVALALTLPGCGVPKSIAWGSFQFDRSTTSLSSLPTQPLSSLTTVGQRSLYSCFEHFEMRGTYVSTCTERGWTPAPMCIPKALCTAGFDPPRHPDFSSSGSYLMIFTSMQFKCDGIVTSWKFYSLSAGQTVFFGVWRPVVNSTAGEIDGSQRSVSYRLVGANTIRTNTANGLETHQIEQPSTVAVRRGDVVGIHYPSVSISASQMVIPFADDLEPRPWTREQLFSGRVKAAAHGDIMANGGVIHFDEPERKRWRIPALQAIVTASFIDCGPVPSLSHATLITGHGTRQSAVHRFACDEGFHLIGSPTIVCNSDGEWSALPSCRPIGHCVWNSQSPLVEQSSNGESNSVSKGHLPSSNLPSKSPAATSVDLQLEVSQMVIFTSIPIRCTGLVKEWRFLTLANNEGQQSQQPFTVHIDIWRIVPAPSSGTGLSQSASSMDRERSAAMLGSDSHQHEFVLVGTNTVTLTSSSEAINSSSNSVLTYRVPPESQLFAVVGDFVGWHYDGPAALVSSAFSGQAPVILVAAPDENNDQPSPHEAILAPVFHASLRPGDRHRFASAVRRRLPGPRLEALIDNSQVLPYGLCDGETRCPGNSDCLRRNCFAPACVCRDGFALNANNTLCLPAVQLNQRCDTSVACEAFNSRCSERGVCECLSGWEPASDGRRCRPVSPTAGLAFALRGERCDATRQCYHRWYDQTCTEGVCRCRAGFRAATSIERRAFPHSATECRPVDYNLTSSDVWGDEAWSGDGTGGGGCSMSAAGGQQTAGALTFDPYPIYPEADTIQSKSSLLYVLGVICLVAAVGMSLTAYYSFSTSRHRSSSASSFRQQERHVLP